MQQRGASTKALSGPVRKTEVKPRTLNPVWDEAFPFANIDMDATVVASSTQHPGH